MRLLLVTETYPPARISGALPLRALAQALEGQGIKPHLIGGALEAGELDAKRAIDQAARLAARL